MVAHYEIIKKKKIPLATVRKVLRKRLKSKLTYEQKMALENAEEFTKTSEYDAESIIKDLKALDMRKLKDKFIVKIADLIPQNKEELKIILSSSKISFKDDEIKQILDIVKKNVK